MVKPNWEAFFQLADDLLCMVADDGLIVYVNERFTEVLGWTQDDRIGKPEEYFPELQGSKRLSHVRQAFPCKNGQSLTFCWSSVAIDQDGRTFYYFIGRNLSHETALAGALKVQTLFLEQTSRVGKIGGWEVDVDGKTGKFTAETHRIYGTDPVTYRPNVEKGINAYIPEHRPIIASAFNRLMTTGHPYELELQIINGQGEKLWVRTIGEAQFENGRIVRAYGTLQDISQEKAMEVSRLELEERVAAQRDVLSNLMDLAPIGICRIDPNGICTSVNKAWSRFTTYSAEEAAGRNWLEGVHPEDRERLHGLWNEFLKESNEFKHEFRFSRKTGETVWAGADIIPIRHQDGQILEFLACIVDMTEQKRILSELEKASNAKSMFLANVSHEIRTPLNAIIGFSQILADSEGLQNTIYREDIIHIKRSGELLLAIINDVLDISKIEAGNLIIEQRPFRIQEAVHHVIEMIRPAAEKKNLGLALTCDPNLPSILVGDELRLKQILINLTSNAVKFTEQGGIRIRIGCHESENTLLRQVSITVQDTGIGIPSEHLKHIFLPFSQADSSTTRKFGGTGLGLTISKRLCELMGGCIDVYSEEHKGSTFTAHLMLKVGRLDADSVVYGPGLAQDANLSLLRTLIVEDDPLNRKVAIAALKKYGIKAETCNNGLEAVQRCKTTCYDLILMDVQMPLMGGYEATTHIRREGLSQHAWILAMTANAFDEDRRLCLEAGMSDFMPKPIDFRALQHNLYRAVAALQATEHQAA